MKYKVVNLLCGVGGFSKGFEMTEKFDVIRGYDNRKDFLETYNYNIHGEGINYDITNEVPHDLINNNIDIIIGSVPCPTFSITKKNNYKIHRKNNLLLNFIHWVSKIKPKIVLMENVSGILTSKNGDLLKLIREEYKNIGYDLEYFHINFKDFGIPQNKKRVIFIVYEKNISKLEPDFQEIINKNKTYYDNININAAISDLPFSAETEITDYHSEAKNYYQKIMRSKSKKIYNHLAKKINEISTSKENINKKFDGNEIAKAISFRDFYRGDKLKHPSTNRLISLREGARIQGFPDDFIFKGSFHSIGIQITNSLSPLIAKEVALYIYHILSKNDSENIVNNKNFKEYNYSLSKETVIKRVINICEKKLRKTIRERPKKEKEIQDKFETILIGEDILFSRERDTIKYSSKNYIPDFTFEEIDLALEIKFCARKNRKKEIIGEINDDILAYKRKYSNLIFVIYDTGFIRDVDGFKNSFEQNENVIIKVVKH